LPPTSSQPSSWAVVCVCWAGVWWPSALCVWGGVMRGVCARTERQAHASEDCNNAVRAASDTNAARPAALYGSSAPPPPPAAPHPGTWTCPALQRVTLRAQSVTTSDSRVRECDRGSTHRRHTAPQSRGQAKKKHTPTPCKQHSRAQGHAQRAAARHAPVTDASSACPAVSYSPAASLGPAAAAAAGAAAPARIRVLSVPRRV
jgi:hypothetical protein